MSGSCLEEVNAELENLDKLDSVMEAPSVDALKAKSWQKPVIS